MNGKTVRNLGLVAVAVIAAVAIACGGGTSHDSSTASTGDSFGGEAATTDGAPQRDLSVLLGEKGAVEAPSIGQAPAPQSADGTTSNAGSNAGGGTLAPGGSPSDPAGSLQGIDRKIVQTASLQMQVDEVGVGFEEVGRIATAAGGFVASSSFSYIDNSGIDSQNNNDKRSQTASVTIRVPAENYQSVLSQLRGLAKAVDSEESQSADVTGEYTDLNSRLRNLEATQTQLLTLLGQAHSITDILTVQDRLNSVQGDIEYVKGRLQLIGDLTDLATVTVHLRPVAGALPPVDNGNGVNLGRTISQAWDDSLTFLGNIAEGVLTVVVFGWWVPLIAVPAGAIAWAATRRGPNGHASAVD
jgi:Domain of unknown function (DUF4349)